MPLHGRSGWVEGWHALCHMVDQAGHRCGVRFRTWPGRAGQNIGRPGCAKPWHKLHHIPGQTELWCGSASWQARPALMAWPCVFVKAPRTGPWHRVQDQTSLASKISWEVTVKENRIGGWNSQTGQLQICFHRLSMKCSYSSGFRGLLPGNGPTPCQNSKCFKWNMSYLLKGAFYKGLAEVWKTICKTSL